MDGVGGAFGGAPPRDALMRDVQVWELFDSSDDERNNGSSTRTVVEESNVPYTSDEDKDISMASSDADDDSVSSEEEDDDNMSSEHDYTDAEPDVEIEASPYHLQRLEQAGWVGRIGESVDYETEDDEDIFNEASDTEETRHTYVDLIADGDGRDHDPDLERTVEEEIEEASICQTDSEDDDVHHCGERYAAIKYLDDDLSQTSEEGSAVLNFEETEQMRRDEMYEEAKARCHPPLVGQKSLGTLDGNRVRFFDLEVQKCDHLYGDKHKNSSPWDKSSWLTSFEMLQWNIAEVDEMLLRLTAERESLALQLQAAEQEKNASLIRMAQAYNDAGISQQLFDAYEEFCTSLEPEFGQRGGFSITCEDHEGSYTDFDPQYELFKENVEMSYEDCNFRCEASSIEDPTEKHIVEFWPIQPPEPRFGPEVTWGDQYPQLYEYARSAAANGSQAALDMLVNLPDQHGYMQGGWLFEYRFEETLQNHPVLSKRWVFDSAHMIDRPLSMDEKEILVRDDLREDGATFQFTPAAPKPQPIAMPPLFAPSPQESVSLYQSESPRSSTSSYQSASPRQSPERPILGPTCPHPCDQCRDSRTRCSRDYPFCSRCTARGTDCHYEVLPQDPIIGPSAISRRQSLGSRLSTSRGPRDSFDTFMTENPSTSSHQSLNARQATRRACTQCRNHKTRCTLDVPTCSRCVQRGVECHYDVLPQTSLIADAPKTVATPSMAPQSIAPQSNASYSITPQPVSLRQSPSPRLSTSLPPSNSSERWESSDVSMTDEPSTSSHPPKTTNYQGRSSHYPELFDLPETASVQARKIFQLTQVRNLSLRPGKSIDLNKPDRKSNLDAALAHQRGKIAPIPCGRCKKGVGVHFQQCVVLPGFFKGACSSCVVAGATLCGFHAFSQGKGKKDRLTGRRKRMMMLEEKYGSGEREGREATFVHESFGGGGMDEG